MKNIYSGILTILILISSLNANELTSKEKADKAYKEAFFGKNNRNDTLQKQCESGDALSCKSIAKEYFDQNIPQTQEEKKERDRKSVV